MDAVLRARETEPVAGVFLDLGISSPQFDDAGRGFRPEQDGPLDLRFDVTRGVPAFEFLRSVDRDDLRGILEAYGETSDPVAARRVADAVALAREDGALPETTKAFAALVASAKGKEYQAMHPAKLTFQALRIHLNQEFDEMRRGMRAAMEVMGDGGRLAVLTVRGSFRVFSFSRSFSRSVPRAVPPAVRACDATPCRETRETLAGAR
jgi:16S rRNA (cytosine1402-N4)-methyltransferase